MKLELNLVNRTLENRYLLRLVSRKRVQLASDTHQEVIAECIKFLLEESAYIDTVLPDKGLMSYLSAVDSASLSIHDLFSIKYSMTAAGVDLLFYMTDNDEVNPEDISADLTEYNIIDNLIIFNESVKLSNKLLTDRQSAFSGVLESVIKSYSAREDLYLPVKNTLEANLQALKEVEATGNTSSSLQAMLVDMLRNLGTEIVVIIPQNV